MLSATAGRANDYRACAFRHAVTFDSGRGVLDIRRGDVSPAGWRVGGGREERDLGLGDDPADGDGDGRDGVVDRDRGSRGVGTGGRGAGEAAARGADDRAG